jgi:ketosteroid isomerase-like protein
MSLRAGKVTVRGDQATATADLRLNATLVDEQGHAQPLVLRQTSNDTWKKTTAGWKMTRRDELTSE